MGTMDQQWWVVGPRSARLLPEVLVFLKVVSKPYDFFRLLICRHIMRPNLVERIGHFYAGVFEDGSKTGCGGRGRASPLASISTAAELETRWRLQARNSELVEALGHFDLRVFEDLAAVRDTEVPKKIIR